MTLLAVPLTIFRNISAAGTSMVLIDGSNNVDADPNSLVNEITTVGLSLGVAVAVILVAIGGYKMLASKGDPNAIKDAQDQIQNAIMGFMLILVAVTVVRIILTALGLTSLVDIN